MSHQPPSRFTFFCRQASAILPLIIAAVVLLRLGGGCFELGALQSGCRRLPSGALDCSSSPPDSSVDLAGQQPGADLAQPVDMAVPIQIPDLTAPPDLAYDPSMLPGPAPGCVTGSGYKLTDKLHACPGVFSKPDGDKRCAAGWAMPVTLSISAAACASVPWGFFAGAAHGLGMFKNPDATMICDWQSPNPNYTIAYRFGCGPVGRSINAKIYTFASVNICGGFPVVTGCTGTAFGFSSTQTPFICDPPSTPYQESFFPLQTALTRAADGILCAAP